MAKRLVIVESPTKAKTISKFLGSGFEVTSSFGHVRDLPNSASEIPLKLKKEKWATLGVNVDSDFEPLYIIPPEKKKHVDSLKQLLKGCSELLLATDEDREGESISWHLLEVLSPKIPVHRLVFHEITKEAIGHALEATRKVDLNLVKAQETRRIIDRLFGYSVSPVLWKKMKPRLSAGRVQSVALRLLVERERARIKFKSADYWDLKATFLKDSGESFEAELTHVDGKRVAQGKDFDANTGKLLGSEVVHLDQARAERLKQSLTGQSATVIDLETKPYTARPSPPFTTSTLQQEGNRKLRLSAQDTMSIAQNLYENGLITYMRTDSTSLSEEAIDGARAVIQKDFGAEYLPAEPRLYKTSVRNAQEAHEAIRPAGAAFASPDEVVRRLGPQAGRLYELIWKRTLASQMKDAYGTRVSVQLDCGNGRFRATGKTIEFAGFLRAYVEGSDDPEADLADQERHLPVLTLNEKLSVKEIEPLIHSTQPPPRFTEGSLIKELERLGIGRPSTWASIVGLVLSRNYAFKKGTALVPTFLATALTGLMERFFTKLVDYSFTAELEDDLDSISRGEADNLKYLKKFYFGNGTPGLKDLVNDGEEKIDPREVCGIPLGAKNNGGELEVRIGRYGTFLTDGTVRASLPEFLAPDELSLEKAQEFIATAAKGPQALGTDPVTGKAVYARSGRFGPYVQLGESGKDEEKPKMASLLPGMALEEMDLATALSLLSLPRNLGPNPESGTEILAANGRYGPYVKCGTETRSIPEGLTPLTISLEQAVELLKQPKRRGRATAQPKILKELGKHPATETVLVIKSGRYGPYVTDGTLNASLPRGMDYNEMVMDDAVNLLAERARKLSEPEMEAPPKRAKKASKAPKAKEPKAKPQKSKQPSKRKKS